MSGHKVKVKIQKSKGKNRKNIALDWGYSNILWIKNQGIFILTK